MNGAHVSGSATKPFDRGQGTTVNAEFAELAERMIVSAMLAAIVPGEPVSWRLGVGVVLMAAGALLTLG
jgi:hypothetical protein